MRKQFKIFKGRLPNPRRNMNKIWNYVEVVFQILALAINITFADSSLYL